MAETFYFSGNEAVGAALEKSLVESGFMRVSALNEARFVFSYFPVLSRLEDAYFDEKGFLAQAEKDSYLVDLSPATPELSREIAAIASVSDLHYVEAPIEVADYTLADAFSHRDNVCCSLAGDKSDVTAVRDALQNFAATLRVFEEPGAAQLAHAANTLQRVGQLMAAVETEALYRAALRIPTSASVASEGLSGLLSSGSHAATIASAITEQRFSGTYTVEMLMADLSAALTIANALDLTLPQAETCMSLLETLAIIGGSDLSPVSLALIYDEEEAAANNGLDWSRSQDYINEMGAHEHNHASHEHAHVSEDDFDDFDDFNYGEDALAESDDEEAEGAFGGYADLLKDASSYSGDDAF